MAKLFMEARDERGVDVQKIGNKQICADFYYGSRERSIKALTVCVTVEPDLGKEKAVVVTQFIDPAGYAIHFHKEEYPMPEKRVLLKEMVVPI